MTANTLVCICCSDSKSLVRILKCAHELCEQCCKDNIWTDLSNSEEQVICPVSICQTTTKLLNNISELPKKLCVKLICTNCSKECFSNDLWWCSDCAETICRYGRIVCSFTISVSVLCFSKCAMSTGHRQHDCNIWFDERIIEEAFELFEPFLNFNEKTMNQGIDEFCTKLADELKDRLTNLFEVCNFVKAVTNVYRPHFATVTVDPRQKPNDDVKKHLRAINSLMCAIDRRSCFDIDRVIQLFTMKQKYLNFIFPPIDTISDLLFNVCDGDDSLLSAKSGKEITEEKERATNEETQTTSYEANSVKPQTDKEVTMDNKVLMAAHKKFSDLFNLRDYRLESKTAFTLGYSEIKDSTQS